MWSLHDDIRRTLKQLVAMLEQESSKWSEFNPILGKYYSLVHKRSKHRPEARTFLREVMRKWLREGRRRQTDCQQAEQGGDARRPLATVGLYAIHETVLPILAILPSLGRARRPAVS